MGNCESAMGTAGSTALQGEAVWSEPHVRHSQREPAHLGRCQKQVLRAPVLPQVDCDGAADDRDTACSPANSQRAQTQASRPATLTCVGSSKRKVMIVSSEFKDSDMDLEPQSIMQSKLSESIPQQKYKAFKSRSFASNQDAENLENSIGEFVEESNQLNEEFSKFRRVGSCFGARNFKHISKIKAKSAVLDDVDKFRQMFDSIDKNKDGRIDAGDMLQLLGPSGLDPESADLLQFLQLAVRDATNHQRDFWNFEDFKRYFSQIAGVFSPCIERN